MGMPESQLRKKGAQGAANMQAMSPEEQQAFINQNFAMLIQALGAGGAGTTTEDPYQSALAEFAGSIDLQRRAFLQHGVGPRAPLTRPQEGYTISATGKILYSNGVIADPASGTAPMFPTNDPDAEGSEAWLRKVQDKWSDKQANSWRKRLVKEGYDTLPGGLAESGGWAMDLTNALRTYHQNRYLNYGKPIPLVPKDAISRESVREQFDFAELKERAKGWGEVPFGEDLDESTADFFAEKIVTEAVQIARKHPTWSFEQVEAGAEMRAQKEFIKTPGVGGALREAEEDEMDESLRQNIVSISQLRSI